ncbi:MAG: hypothetical protein V9G20_29885 [Candidatus Promineifilaceae bacterium]
MSVRTVGVIDIGKSNAKFAVVDLDTRAEIDVRKRPNIVQSVAPYPHFDIAGLWEFLVRLDRRTRPGEPARRDLSVTTHGACAALVDATGELALPVLDYEYHGPGQARGGLRCGCRPAISPKPFTPRLPVGLNLGAQLYWQSHELSRRSSTPRPRWVLPYPQYWAWRLAGVAGIGSHLARLPHRPLEPGRRMTIPRWSTARAGDTLFPPIHRAGRPRWAPSCPTIAARTGLPADTPVFCGIHDFQRLAPAPSAGAQGALRGRVDRHLGHRHGGRRQGQATRPGARHA